MTTQSSVEAVNGLESKRCNVTRTRDAPETGNQGKR